MGLPRIVKEDNCLYLIQDIGGLDTYERSKAIVNFCDKETKRFEKEIDSVITDIFQQNGINIATTTKSVLKSAFDTLNAKGKTIEIVDLLKNSECELITTTKNHFNVMLETIRVADCYGETLQCGVMVEERKIR